jgi:hypothetical protein
MGQRLYAVFFANKLSAFCTIFIVTMCIALFNSPYTHFPHYDVEVFRHIGMNIYKGYVPYKDAFDHKPPLVYFIAAMLYPLGIWGNWFFGVLCATAAAYCLWLLSTFYKFKYTWVLPLSLLFLLFWQKELVGRYADTRYFTTVFLCILLYLVLVKTEKWFLCKGIIAALVFLTQQNEILIAALLLTLNFKLLFNTSLQKALKAFGSISIGFFSLLVVPILYFWANHALADLYYGVFKFNTTYFLKPIKLSLHLFRAKQLWLHSFIPKFFVALMLSFLGSYFFDKRKLLSADLFIFTLLIIATSIYNITLSGYYWKYYTFHLIVPCILMLIAMVIWVEALQVSIYFKTSLLGIMVLSIMARRSIIKDAFTTFRTYGLASSYHERYKYFQQDLDTIVNKSNSLFILGDASTLSLANNNGIRTNTKWILNYFWDDGTSQLIKFDTDGTIFNNELLLPLRTHKPSFLVFIREFEGSGFTLRPDIKRSWQQFVDSNYIYHKTADWDTAIVMYKLKL